MHVKRGVYALIKTMPIKPENGGKFGFPPFYYFNVAVNHTDIIVIGACLFYTLFLSLTTLVHFVDDLPQ